jgi:hypothetical protein
MIRCMEDGDEGEAQVRLEIYYKNIIDEYVLVM